MVNFKLEEDSLKCIFNGRMDTAACQTIAGEIDDQLNKNAGMSVIFDMENVGYVSSAFLRICIKASKKLGNESFSIKNVDPQVKKVFKISGFDSIMNIE